MKKRINSSSFVAIVLMAMAITVSCTNKNNDNSAIGWVKPSQNSEKEKVSNSTSNTSDKTETIQSETFKYWFIQDGCSTQKQVFDSKESLCKGLQDQGLNKNCALDLRKKEFKKVNCPGEFTEISDTTESKNKGPSPIRCVGRVAGFDGEMKIDKTINWDRKTYQKIVLSEFKDVKDAGEYSLRLIPQDPNSESPMMLVFGWFIDNNKNQVISGRIDSKVYFYHKDDAFNGREVEIECAPLELEKKAAIQPKGEMLEMVCLAFRGPLHGEKDILTAHFFWDQRGSITETLLIQKDEKPIKSDFNVALELNKESGLPTINISNLVDGHVHFVGQVQGKPEINAKYMSAWDDKDILISCHPKKSRVEDANKK